MKSPQRRIDDSTVAQDESTAEVKATDSQVRYTLSKVSLNYSS